MPEELPNQAPTVEPPNPVQAPAPEQPQQPIQDMDPKARWRLQRFATFAATVTLATLTGTPRIAETTVDNPLHPQDPVTRVVPGSERPPVIKVGDTEVTVTMDQKTEQQDAAQELWAKLFSSDEQAGKLTGQGELTKVRDRIDGLREQGFKITKVSLEGHASAEDDSVNASGQRTSGIQTPDVENRRLANKRARTFRGLFKKDLKEHDEAVPPIEMKSPIENFLTDSEREQVQKLAAENGYEHVVNMIEDYNRGEGVSGDVSKYLDEILAKERKVVVTIDAERSAVFRTDVPTTDMIPGGNPPSVETTPGGDSSKIPIAVPLILFLPIFLRRKSPTARDGIAEPLIETPVVPPVPPAETSGTFTMVPPVLDKSPSQKKEQHRQDELPGARLQRDYAFKARTIGGQLKNKNIPALQRDKRPQESNFHGHKGVNQRHVQNRGGGRPAPRRSRGPRRAVVR